MQWINVLLAPVAILYFLVVVGLFIYGSNFYYLTLKAFSRRGQLKSAPLMPPNVWPRVTVQLPIYNERFVARRLIESTAALDYPRDLLEIQALDDSTDDTTQIISETVDRLRASGLNVKHLHRADRRGFKAGALADGLAVASGELITIFDADFIPASDFLKRMIPHFDKERVAFVQARWGHLNRDYSLLTSLQSLSIDSHFAVEQLARSRLGYFFNFNGTAGIWRKSAIEDAGGWKAETLTEDLDLSYRVFLRGWEARYAGEIEALAELPISMPAYRRQQNRWARGSLECAIRYVPVLWESELPFLRKLEGILHLTGYGIHLLLFMATLLYPIILLLSIDYPDLASLFGLVVVFNLTGLAPTVEFAVGQFALGKNWVKTLPKILFMTVLGAGMMINTMRAALQIVGGKKGVFERTPKYGITQRGQTFDSNQYRVRVDGIVFFEILVGLLNTFTVILAFQLGNYLIGIYAALFAIGLFFVSGLTLIESMPIFRSATQTSPETP